MITTFWKAIANHWEYQDSFHVPYMNMHQMEITIFGHKGSTWEKDLIINMVFIQLSKINFQFTLLALLLLVHKHSDVSFWKRDTACTRLTYFLLADILHFCKLSLWLYQVRTVCLFEDCAMTDYLSRVYRPCRPDYLLPCWFPYCHPLILSIHLAVLHHLSHYVS